MPTSRREQALARIGVLGTVRSYLLQSIGEQIEALEKLTPQYIEALTDGEIETMAEHLDRLRAEREVIAGYVQNILDGSWSWQ